MVISGFLLVTRGRAKRKKENGAEKVLQAGVIFFGPICQVKIIGYNRNPRNLFFLSSKRLTAVLTLIRERAQLIKNRFIEGVGATRLNFYFPFLPSLFSSSFTSLFINHLPFLLLLVVAKCTQHLSFKTEGFPGGSDSKECACNAGEPGSVPGLGRSPGEGNGSPLQ